MTDSRTPSTGDLLDRRDGEDALDRAAARLDGALARLEAGFAALSAKALAAKSAKPAGDRAREAALESALREASGTLGEMIAEVREAIQAAEAEAAEAQDRGQERADGQG